MEIDTKEYSKRVKLIRKKMGLKQLEFAKLLNVSRPTIVRVESGNRIPKTNLIKILIDKGVSPIFLFHGVGEPFDKDYDELKIKKVLLDNCAIQVFNIEDSKDSSEIQI